MGDFDCCAGSAGDTERAREHLLRAVGDPHSDRPLEDLARDVADMYLAAIQPRDQRVAELEKHLLLVGHELDDRTAERDRARDLAAALMEENAEAARRVDVALRGEDPGPGEVELLAGIDELVYAARMGMGTSLRAENAELRRARERVDGQLACATSFDLNAGEFPNEAKVGICRRADDTWVVVRGHSSTRPARVLHRDGHWENERHAAEDLVDGWPHAFRFTLDEAFERARGLLLGGGA